LPADFSPPLDARRISVALAGQSIGREVQVHAELESTNDRVMALGIEGYPHGLVVLAESQSAGRGRRENRWHAAPGRDILMSVLLRPSAGMECWPRMTALAALAICRTIEATRALRPMIKWPNDVYLRNQKVAGILGETFQSASGPFLVLGIGLNVNSTRFPADLSQPATSLALESEPPGAMLDRNRTCIQLLKQLEHLIPHLQNFSSVLEEVKRRSWLLGKRVVAVVPTGVIHGTAIDLNPEGHLVMKEDVGGAERVLSSVDQIRVVE
jgi:BirA family biotin operon repressor/biotin-[acetyl-CoA-carboxylase] ligase